MKLVNTLVGHNDCINALSSFSYNDYNYLISGSNDLTVKIWNQTSDKSIYQLNTEHQDSIQAIAYNDRNKYLAIGSKDKSFSLWKAMDEYEGNIVKTISINYRSYALAVLNNSNIVSGSYDRTIKIWNSTSFKVIQTLTGHLGEINDLKILPNSNIVSCSVDKTIKIWKSEYPPAVP